MLCGGTTQVLMVSEYAAVLASDRAQHASNTGRYPQERRKIDQVGDRVIVGVSGACAVIRRDGTAIDLQDSVPPLVRRYDWNEPEHDAQTLSDDLTLVLKTLEAEVLPGSPDPALHPQVKILVAGVSEQSGTFGIRYRYPGRYVTNGDGYRLEFEPVIVDVHQITSGKVAVLIETLSKDVERAAMDLVAGRVPPDPRYPLLAQFRNNIRPDGRWLRAVAEELVRVTMDLDGRIGGGIDALAVESVLE